MIKGTCRALIAALFVTSCASTPEVQPFDTQKISSLSVTKAKEVFVNFVDSKDDMFLDSISNELIVISSTNKEDVVACRVGFGDTFRSAKSKFYFRNAKGIWSVRSEHFGRAGIGQKSDIVELRGVDIPCQSTGYVENSIFKML